MDILRTIKLRYVYFSITIYGFSKNFNTTIEKIYCYLYNKSIIQNGSVFYYFYNQLPVPRGRIYRITNSYKDIVEITDTDDPNSVFFIRRSDLSKSDNRIEKWGKDNFVNVIDYQFQKNQYNSKKRSKSFIKKNGRMIEKTNPIFIK